MGDWLYLCWIRWSSQSWQSSLLRRLTKLLRLRGNHTMIVYNKASYEMMLCAQWYTAERKLISRKIKHKTYTSRCLTYAQRYSMYDACQKTYKPLVPIFVFQLCSWKPFMRYFSLMPCKLDILPHIILTSFYS